MLPWSGEGKHNDGSWLDTRLLPWNVHTHTLHAENPFKIAKKIYFSNAASGTCEIHKGFTVVATTLFIYERPCRWRACHQARQGIPPPSPLPLTLFFQGFPCLPGIFRLWRPSPLSRRRLQSGRVVVAEGGKGRKRHVGRMGFDTFLKY